MIKQLEIQQKISAIVGYLENRNDRCSIFYFFNSTILLSVQENAGFIPHLQFSVLAAPLSTAGVSNLFWPQGQKSLYTILDGRGATSFSLWGYIIFCPTFLPLPDEHFIECIIGRNAWTTFCGL